MKRYIRINTLC